jgi:hypothetical protein
VTLLLWSRFLILGVLLAVAGWLVWAALSDPADDGARMRLPWRTGQR